MTWEFELSGDAWVLDQLVQALQKREVTILKQNGSFFLVGNVFDGIESANDASKAAGVELNKINGLAVLHMGLKTPLQIKAVASFPDGGTNKSIYLAAQVATIETHLSVTVTDAQGNVVSRSPSHEDVIAGLGSAATDKNIHKALRLLGSGDLSWVNLHRICEVIEGDVGNEHELKKKGWVPVDKLELFSRTANSPAAVGDAARHGRQSGEPPKEPMQLHEAQELIKGLVRKWMDKKGRVRSSH